MLDSWRPGRRQDGWKDVGEFVESQSHSNALQPPQVVTGVPRLKSDLTALAALFASLVPPRRVVRGSSVGVVLYGYADASRSGFGSSFLTPAGLRIHYGLWGRDLLHLSSNFRELRNLVNAVEWELVDQFPVLCAAVDAISEWVMSGTSPGLELFLSFHNIVAESAFYRGTSSNPWLFDLIIRLKKLELQYSLHLHVVHIAGTRMMEQGTNVLSRGAVWECDHHPVSVVPLHLSPFDRDPMLLRWCASWIPAGYHLHVLSPQTWFTEGHGIGGGSVTVDGLWSPLPATSSTVFVWHPQPAAADAALEELCFSHQKRPYFRHVLLCPRLFTHAWRKRLFKFADMVFYLKPGFLPDVWSRDQHEPVVIRIFLPVLNQPPWLGKGSPPLLALQHHLRVAFATRDIDLHSILSLVWSLF
jgi:hypothetical protein